MSDITVDPAQYVVKDEPYYEAVGTEVELNFRRLYTAKGVHNYFWKARPLRNTSNGK